MRETPRTPNFQAVYRGDTDEEQFWKCLLVFLKDTEASEVPYVPTNLYTPSSPWISPLPPSFT